MSIADLLDKYLPQIATAIQGTLPQAYDAVLLYVRITALIRLIALGVLVLPIPILAFIAHIVCLRWKSPSNSENSVYADAENSGWFLIPWALAIAFYLGIVIPIGTNIDAFVYYFVPQYAVVAEVIKHLPGK